MDSATTSRIHEAAKGSSEGTLHFGQVIGILSEARVESYLADYRAGRTTYYLPGGETMEVPLEMPDVAIADAFDAEAVLNAIRGAQQGTVKYPEFKRLTCTAGCVGYMVWIAGRHVRYFGRRGESHVERFPN